MNIFDFLKREKVTDEEVLPLTSTSAEDVKEVKQDRKDAQDQSADKDVNEDKHAHRFVPELHGMRGLSALSIAFGHAFPYNPFMRQASTLGFLTFLMLSGQLITGILLRNGSIPVSRTKACLFFALSRIVRLYPALIITSIYASVVRIQAGHEVERVRSQVVSSLLQVENFYANQHKDGYLRHTWYLGMEQQFYVVWPIFVFFAKRFSTQVRIALIVSMLALLSLFNAFTAGVVEQGWWNGMMPWQFLIFGGSMQLIPFPKILTHGRLLAWIGIMLSVAYILFGDFVRINRLQIPAAYVAPLLIFLMINGSISSGNMLLGHSALVFLGRISYAYFLYHVPLMKAYKAFSKSDGLALWIAIGSLVPATVSTLYIEEPLRDWVKGSMAKKIRAQG